MNNGAFYVEAVQAEKRLREEVESENEIEFRTKMADTGMQYTDGVAVEDFDVTALRNAGLSEGVLSPQYMKAGTQQIGNHDAATGERILPPEPEAEAGWWSRMKEAGKDVLGMAVTATANSALFAAGVKEDVQRRVLDTTADMAVSLFGVDESEVVRGEDPTVPYHRKLTDPTVEAWGAEFSRTMTGYVAQFATATGVLRATLGAPATVVGGYAQMAGAGATADFMMDPRYDSIIDAVAAITGSESELVDVINPASVYDSSPLRARAMLAVEGGLVGAGVDAALYGTRAAGTWLRTMRAQAEELEDIGAERLRKSTHSVNAGIDPEGMWGLVEMLTGRILKGADALTPDLRRELAASGATKAQMDNAWIAASDVAENGMERAMSDRAKLRTAQLSQAVPGYRDVAKNLTEQELEEVTKAQAETLVEVFNKIDPKQMQAAALAGQAKKGWYRQSADALLRVFGPEDAPRFTAMLAATSPQTSVESNLRNATAIWRNWVNAGRPNDPAAIKRIMGESVEGAKGEESVLDAWVNNTIRALTAEDARAIVLSGPKVQSFYKNLIGDLNEVTNDAWMANYAGVDQEMFSGANRASARDEVGAVGGKSGGYLGMSARARDVASRLTKLTGEEWTPAEVQETVWSFAKTLYEKRKAQGYTGEKSGKLARELTDAEIGDTPDFGTLLGQDEYGAALREVEDYGQRLDQLAAERADGPGQAREAGAGSGAVKPAPRALGDVAARLEKLYAKRSIPKITADARAGIDLTARPDARGNVPGPFTRGTRRTRTDALNLPGYAHRPNKEFSQRLRHLGAADPKWVELDASEASSDAFHQAITRAKGMGKHGAAVYVYPKEDYTDMKLFTTPDGSAGFAIKPDGDLVSVFSDGSEKWVTPSLMTLAVQQGARKLDAFDTQLMAIYTEAGFKPVARMKWNEEYMPEGWDKETFATFNKGEPDVVAMVYDPNFNGKFAKKDAPYVDSEEAFKAAQEAAMVKATGK